MIHMAMDILNKRDFPRETIVSTSVVDATNAQIMQMQTSHIATLDEKIETMNDKKMAMWIIPYISTIMGWDLTDKVIE